MASALDTLYVALALLVAVLGVLAVMWLTRTSTSSERNTSGYILALGVVLFLVAMVGSLLT